MIYSRNLKINDIIDGSDLDYDLDEDPTFINADISDPDYSDEDTDSEYSDTDDSEDEDIQGILQDAGGIGKWSDTDCPLQLPVFEEECGIKVEIPNDSDEMLFFSLFFPKEIVKHIKSETNRYADTTIAKLRRTNKLKQNSLFCNWKPVTIGEMYYFFAIFMHMCLVKKPHIRDYWSTDPIVVSTFAQSLLSRDRFRSILFMLHLNDNATYISKGEANHDPLHKIRPYFDHVMEKCKTLFKPYNSLTINEAICPSRGRLQYNELMKNNSQKYGGKLYVLRDASTGYMLNAEVYSGSLGNVDNKMVSVVHRLCRDYLGKGHTIYMERFCTSPSLLVSLWHEKTTAVGTVVKNRRGLPTDFGRKIKKGEYLFRRKDNVMAVKWRDTQDVILLSTRHNFTVSEVDVKSKKGMVKKVKPDAVLDYNIIYKTGVDRADQLLSYYAFDKKTVKWWKKLFFRLFMLSAGNSYIIFKMMEGKGKTSLNDYLKVLGKKLAEEGLAANAPQLPVQSTSSSSLDRLTSRHFPEKIPPTKKKKHPTRYCRVCSDTGKAQTGQRKRKETRYSCKNCKVALCVPGCFELYHTKVKYTN